MLQVFFDDTGIAGLTLGGGYGWLMGRYGLTCDNLLAAEMVTAQGELVTASADRHPDLFWGLRGGGGNFGVVTAFHYRLHPVGTLLAGAVIFPFAQARQVLQGYRDYALQAPDEVTAFACFISLPDGAPALGVFACYNGPLDRGEALLLPLRALGDPLHDDIQPRGYQEVQAMLDDAESWGSLNYWKSNFLASFDDRSIDTFLRSFEDVPSPQSGIVIQFFGGATSRVDPLATAFAHRDPHFGFVAASRWSDGADTDRQIRWARQVWEAQLPFSSGASHINYLDREPEERVQAAYGAETYRRLVALKDRWDSTNLFCLNQNIRPSAC